MQIFDFALDRSSLFYRSDTDEGAMYKIILMRSFDNENILDFISTKGGRCIVKPAFGDRISLNDWFKKPVEKKIIQKKKLSVLDRLKKKGYVRTYIECNKGIIMLSRVVTFRECSNIFQGVKSVYYGSNKEEYSQLFYS